MPGDPFASIAKFVQECKIDEPELHIQTDQSIRLGYWMNWDRTDSDWAKEQDEQNRTSRCRRNNYTIWSFLKKCHQRRLIYRGYDAMPWCPRCAVGLSQMEMHEGEHSHGSVFVEPIRQRETGDRRQETGEKENLLVWTTTPWTLTSNVAAAVNPQLTYVKVRHEREIHYLAKRALTTGRLEEQFKKKEWIEGVPKLKTLEQIFKEKGGFEILAELKGADLVGWTYDGPSTSCRPRAMPPAIRPRSPRSSSSKTGDPRQAQDDPSRHRLGCGRRGRGDRHCPYRTGLRQGRLCTGQGKQACPRGAAR